jgi:hypothetical protein
MNVDDEAKDSSGVSSIPGISVSAPVESPIQALPFKGKESSVKKVRPFYLLL